MAQVPLDPVNACDLERSPDDGQREASDDVRDAGAHEAT